MTQPASPDSWLLASYVANCVVALVALVSLYLSIRSSREVTTALLSIQRGLVSLTEPLIKVIDHKWAMDHNEVTCEHPPIGIFVTYQNLSNVPVIVLDTDLTVFYGERKLDDAVQSAGSSSSGTLVLAPGQTLQCGTIQNELFKRYLSKPKPIFQSPNLNFIFTAKYQSLITNERYVYEVHQEIFFNCAQPDFHGGKTLRESHSKSAA